MSKHNRLSSLRAASAETDNSGDKKANKSEKKKKNKQNNKTAGSALERRIMQAGLKIPERIYLLLVIIITLVLNAIASRVGLVLAQVVTVATLHFLLCGLLEQLAVKRKRKIIPQLAPFIDGLASELSTGFNLEAALVQATLSVPEGPLRIELDRVAGALNSGLAAKEAMAILRDRVAGSEVTSLVVAVSLFASMGGNALEPFRRLAGKIREQQSVMDRAQRDLVLVKQAFVIILLISMGVPGILSLIAPSFLGGAMKSSLGQILVQGSLLIQVAAILIFKKVTNLKV